MDGGGVGNGGGVDNVGGGVGLVAFPGQGGGYLGDVEGAFGLAVGNHDANFNVTGFEGAVGVAGPGVGNGKGGVAGVGGGGRGNGGPRLDGGVGVIGVGVGAGVEGAVAVGVYSYLIGVVAAGAGEGYFSLGSRLVGMSVGDGAGGGGGAALVGTEVGGLGDAKVVAAEGLAGQAGGGVVVGVGKG